MTSYVAAVSPGISMLHRGALRILETSLGSYDDLGQAKAFDPCERRGS